jgi:general stress protein YciG
MEEDAVGTELRGFASMNRKQKREIASMGGRAAHAKGTAHEWSSQEAREAGQKGGLARAQKRRAARVRKNGNHNNTR